GRTSMRNADVASLLDQIAGLLDIKGELLLRVRAFREAAQAIRGLGEDIATLWREDRLSDIRGVGTSIAGVIKAYLRTGHSACLADLQPQEPAGALELMQIPGLGPHRARVLSEQLGITSIEGLIRAATNQALRGLPGMGATTEAKLLREANRVAARSRRIPLFVAWPLAEDMATQLQADPAIVAAAPVGSIRRRKETIGDIDVLLATTDAAAAFRHAASLPLVREVVTEGPAHCTVLTHDHLQIDLWAVTPDQWGAALQSYTGSKAHNIHLRTLAANRGLKLNQYGLFRADGFRFAGETEAGVFDALGLAWIPPELREDQGEIEAAATDSLPDLIELEDIRGDCHTHTTYSDGRNRLEEMADAAIARGYAWLLVTDHSYSLTIAKGLTQAKALAQRRAIAELNRRLAPFRILQGVELEIRMDGSLDCDDPFLATFDMVGASLHPGTRRPNARHPARLLGAMADPFGDVINQPTGGVFGKQAPYEVDMERVIETAIQTGTALEINGSHRFDLSSALARHARDLGAVFTLSSDAHSVAELDGMRYAVAFARRAWIDKAHVLNARDVDSLLRQVWAA
ncbi:MAG: DNA polymerase/3'-5' exonuclease PolX, partial [Candidatus Sericytochromatia bacterium]|nr:DNA polymerase/3'-5' exonuclease PolX [Candidatus Sericytochromatia bacterium]